MLTCSVVLGRGVDSVSEAEEGRDVVSVAEVEEDRDMVSAPEVEVVSLVGSDGAVTALAVGGALGIMAVNGNVVSAPLVVEAMGGEGSVAKVEGVERVALKVVGVVVSVTELGHVAVLEVEVDEIAVCEVEIPRDAISGSMVDKVVVSSVIGFVVCA